MEAHEELRGVNPKCRVCEGTGISDMTAITPLPCGDCARRAMNVPMTPYGDEHRPYSVWHTKR